jgi:signal transduction histidine kinase
MDLGGYDPVKNGPVRLDGEWEFYWNRLLSPEDFHGAHLPTVSGFLALPTAWNGVNLKGKKLGGTGFATFRLRILPGPGKQELALHFVDLNSAYRLWANGTLLAEGGVVGRSAAEEITNQTILLPRLSLGGQQVELVLQVSNHHYREGGVVSSLELGPTGMLETAQLRQWGLALFCSGSLVVMGIYHLALFCFRRENRAPLHFGIYALLWAGYALTSSSNGWVVRHFCGPIPVGLLNRFDLLCIVISVPVGYSFFRTLYPEEFSRRVQHLAWVVASLFAGLGFAASTMSFTRAFPGYYLFSGLLILYCLAMLFTAVRRGREGASFIFLGFVVLGFSGINDMLCDLQLIRSVYLIHAGMFVFMLFQAVALSLRFSLAFSAVEKLSGELADNNLALEAEMAERNRLEREIVNVSEDERRRISHDLHDGLCQQLVGARLHFSVLERNLAGSEQQRPEMAEVSSLLDETVNNAYNLSRGLWPVEHDPKGGSPSLEELARRLAESSGIAIEFSQERGCVSCSNGCMTHLYRIAQEAITNAVKHSRANRIVVTLQCRDRTDVTLTVQDNGVGRSAGATTVGGMGMGIMLHRARIIDGTLNVADAKGGGTLVTCIAPCEADRMEVEP